jgi:hypothetical protein
VAVVPSAELVLTYVALGQRGCAALDRRCHRHARLRIHTRPVRRPVDSSIVKWFCRHSSQEVCPYNRKFAREHSEPSFAPRSAISGKDASTLAREHAAWALARVDP